jgi:rare lipoprotein A (peptidoglycan hydrolase)
VQAAVAAATALLVGLVGTTTAAGTTAAPVRGSEPAGRLVTQSDVAALDAALDRATRAAQAAADEVFQAAATSTGMRIALDEATAVQDEARAALGDRARQIYMSGQPDPLTSMLLGMSGTDISAYAQGVGAGVRTDVELIAAAEQDAAAVAELHRRVEADRQSLLARARRVYDLQDRARRLLAAAEAAYAGDRAKLAELARRRASLDAQSRTVSHAATPAVTARGRRAAAAEAPIIAALEAAGSAFPPGYRRTGQRLTGEASWYGPGFVGNPTATGAPYDPERFTAAMLAVPLGTVVRVTTAGGRAVNVLINDRGPYAHGRIIDMSAAGARMLGFTGVKQVTVEVLEPIR